MVEWMRAGLASVGAVGMGLSEGRSVIAGLVACGRWPDFGAWCEARYPTYDTDDPMTLLGKLL
jgi:hypothetical protein